MVDYACDDGMTIKANMARIARESKPLVSRLHEFDGKELTEIGARNDVPREMAESDYAYRLRLKAKLGIV